MPDSRRSDDIDSHPAIPHGLIDTVWIKSKYLRRQHPVFIYTPPGLRRMNYLPVVFVTDGGDYLSFGKMNVVLDNLIARKQIRPIIAVFVDPRTDPVNPASNKRMTEYAASDSYLDFLEKEVAAMIGRLYPVTDEVANRLILGASMGGLISTYAFLTREHFVNKC